MPSEHQIKTYRVKLSKVERNQLIDMLKVRVNGPIKDIGHMSDKSLIGTLYDGFAYGNWPNEWPMINE